MSRIAPSVLPRRRWLFRLAAVGLGLSVLVMAEGVCRLAGWGVPDAKDDPYVTFAGVRPLFLLNAQTDRFKIARNRLDYFSPDSFPRCKPSNGYRIFVLGESTVEGEPYNSRTSFTTWLELNLKASDPRRDWDVVNCGGISYASYRLVPILQECLKYEPDLLVLAIGHNEFLEDRTYRAVKRTSPAVRALHLIATRSQLYNVVRSSVVPSRVPPNRDVLPEEVRARLDFRGGLEAYHHDDAWRESVVEHYERNLRRMLFLAREAGVPVILIRQTSNLCDVAPFKSEHRPGLSEADRARFDGLVTRARSTYGKDPARARSLLRQAIAIDGRFAAVHFELGKCLQHAGQLAEARDEFLAARDEDVCPLRMISALEVSLREIAHDTRTPLFDAHDLLERRSPGKILGGEWLVDHVHPSIAGHQVIANALADLLAEQDIVQRRAGWESARDEAYRRHMHSLDAMYYLKGERTLKALRGWTEGKADKPLPKGARRLDIRSR